MTTRHAPSPPRTETPTTPPVSSLRSFTEWFAGILGAIAIFMGAFILLASDTQSVGFWGDASWEVGEVAAWWGIGLIAGGAITVLAAIASIIQHRH